MLQPSIGLEFLNPRIKVIAVSRGVPIAVGGKEEDDSLLGVQEFLIVVIANVDGIGKV